MADEFLNFDNETEEIEFLLLQQAVVQKYGYDFRNYAQASLLRRFKNACSKLNFKNFSDLQGHVLRDTQLFKRFLADVTVGTTEMFRDPQFFRALREKVFPMLASYPNPIIWQAGCSTGEETYSLTILLEEAGLLDRTRIYATDLNKAALEHTKEGFYRAEDMRRHLKNYRESGGSEDFSTYYSADYGYAKMNPKLLKNVTFLEHNLAVDQSFVEANFVVCRNVLIYFDKTLQARVLDLFARSLCYKGYLALGSKESLRFSPMERYFNEVDLKNRIFQKALDQ